MKLVRKSATQIAPQPFQPAPRLPVLKPSDSVKKVNAKYGANFFGPDESRLCEEQLSGLKQLELRRRIFKTDYVHPRLVDHPEFDFKEHNNFRARAESDDFHIEGLFIEPNEHYRRKFRPKIDPNTIPSESDVHHRFVRRFNSEAEIENIKNHGKRLGKFNEKYQGNYDDLVIASFKKIVPNDNYNKAREAELMLQARMQREKGREDMQSFDPLHKAERLMRRNIFLDKQREENLITNFNRLSARKIFDQAEALEQAIRSSENNFDEIKLPIIQPNEKRYKLSSNLKKMKYDLGLVRTSQEEPAKKIKFDIPEEEGGFIRTCPEGCGRRFNLDALKKHVNICKKVFQGKRPAFNISHYRNRDLKKSKVGSAF